MDAESSTPLEAQPAGGATPRGSAQPARAYARGTTVAITAIWAVLSVAGLFALNTATAVISGRMWWLLDGYDNRLPLDYLPQIKQAESLAGSEAWLIDVPLWIRLISSAGSLISVAVLVTAGIVLHRIVFSHPPPKLLALPTSRPSYSTRLRGRGGRSCSGWWPRPSPSHLNPVPS